MFLRKRFGRLKQCLPLAMKLFLLLLSWIAMFFWVKEFVMLAVIPYDDVMPEARPLPGTWQRQLNDFFERPPWRLVPAWFITGVSIAVFLILLTRSSPLYAAHIGLSLALSNFLLIIVSIFIGYVLASVPLFFPSLNPPFDPHPGYGWTFKFIVSDALLIGLWLAFQIRNLVRGWKGL